jgi:sugar (pentulose or hexulose) kinase
MHNPYFLALDYGTQSVRALVFDSHGAVIAREQLKVEAFRPGVAKSAEQDPQYCYARLVEAIQLLLANNPLDAAQIQALSLTCQRGCSMLLDGKGQAISPVYMWSDRRLACEDKLSPMSWYYRLGFGLLGLGRRISYLRRAARVNYLAQHEGATLARAHKFGMLSGYLIARMTGVLVDSLASQVGYLPFDYRRQQWARRGDWRWQALACKPWQMLPLVSAAQPIGAIGAAFAADTGLQPGTLVVSGGGDKACEVFATGSGEPGIANVSLGSAATLSIGMTEYRETLRYMPSFPALPAGEYINELQLERGFWLLSWLIEEFGHQDRIDAERLGMGVEELICQKIADIPPGADGLLLSPTWAQGVIFPGPEARGAMVGFTPEHTRLHLYRAAIEGILFTLKSALGRLEKVQRQPVRLLRVSGGGAKSKIVLQMAANILGLPVETIQVNEASALGAAMCCAVATGQYADLHSARHAMMKTRLRLNPEPQMQAKYAKLSQIHAKLYPQLAPIFTQLTSLPTHL